MKRILLWIFSFLYLQGYAQVFFSKVYSVPEDGSGLVNAYPNWLTAIFPTDSLIYAFGYSADTSYKDIFGTAFYTFDWEGNLLDYYHIKDNVQYNFFFPEGIHTWDGVTFYTGFNHKYIHQSILKFNRITKQQEVLEIHNSVIQNGDILRSNMTAANDGSLITANEIAVDSTGYNYKIQVTKIDTSGNTKWQTIVGREPVNGFENHCFSSYVDKKGNIYIGNGYSDNLGLGWRADYQSQLYKLNPEGSIVKVYSSKQATTGFCYIYDITQDENGRFYLSSDYNYNEPQYPYGNQGYAGIQILDSTLNLKDNITLDFRYAGRGAAWLYSFEKIIRSNKNDGVVVGGSIPIKDTLIQFTDSIQRLDTIIGFHELLNLVKINDSKQIEWRKIFRIRNGKDDGYLYDIKSCLTGGYIIAASSYLDDAREKNGEPYYMPWLLRVDDDGCLIPGCGTVSNKDLESKQEIIIYPNPASNYIVLLHSGTEKTRYQIISLEGKIMDDFYSYLTDEQIIIPIYHYKPGTYFVKAKNPNGYRCSKIFIKD